MDERGALQEAAAAAVARHAELARDRTSGDGRLGDAELTDMLVVAYPTLAGQRN